MSIDVDALALSNARVEYLNLRIANTSERLEKFEDELSVELKTREAILTGKI